MSDFNETLDFGMINRIAADIGAAAVIKAIHIAVDKMILEFNQDELLGYSGISRHLIPYN